MMNRKLLARFMAAAALTAGLSTCSVHALSLTVSPVAGYRFGGKFADVQTGESLSLDESAVLGLRLAFPIAFTYNEPTSAVEIMYARQDSQVTLSSFGISGSSVDFVTDNFLLGVKHHFYEESLYEYDWVKPYAGGYIGFARFSSADGEVESDTSFSLSGSLGADLIISTHFALFLEGRAYASFVDGESAAVCSSYGGCAIRYDGSTFWQGEVNAGLSISF